MLSGLSIAPVDKRQWMNKKEGAGLATPKVSAPHSLELVTFWAGVWGLFDHGSV
jgi:hypothetical protein